MDFGQKSVQNYGKPKNGQKPNLGSFSDIETYPNRFFALENPHLGTNFAKNANSNFRHFSPFLGQKWYFQFEFGNVIWYTALQWRTESPLKFSCWLEFIFIGFLAKTFKMAKIGQNWQVFCMSENGLFCIFWRFESCLSRLRVHVVIILTMTSETVVQGPRRALDEPQVPGRVPDHRKLGPKNLIWQFSKVWRLKSKQ